MSPQEEYIYESMGSATREWHEEELRYQSSPKVEAETLFCKKHSAIRPAHYGGEDSTYEVFNVLEAWDLDKDFYLGNVIKYVARAGKKNKSKEKEDLQKALVYLQRRINSL